MGPIFGMHGKVLSQGASVPNIKHVPQLVFSPILIKSPHFSPLSRGVGLLPHHGNKTPWFSILELGVPRNTRHLPRLFQKIDKGE